MKKTLVAIAALTAASAFAQSSVTLGGTYNFGLQKKDNGATNADFFDSKVNFSAVEDLGGGLKATVFTEMQLGGRANLAPTTVDTKSSNVWARNATMSLSTPVGTFTGGRVESTNLHQNAQVAGASLNDGFDKAGVAGALANYNNISYVSPAFNGVSVNVGQSKLLDNNYAPAATTASAELIVTSMGLSYANGPVAAGYVNKKVDVANATTTDGDKNEFFVTYDFGVAKAGYGYGKNSGARYAGEKATTIYSVLVPVNANLSVGADFARRDLGGDSADKNGKGTAFAVNYALSKRTKVNATFGKIEGEGLIGENQYRVGMFHNF